MQKIPILKHSNSHMTSICKHIYVRTWSVYLYVYFMPLSIYMSVNHCAVSFVIYIYGCQPDELNSFSRGHQEKPPDSALFVCCLGRLCGHILYDCLSVGNNITAIDIKYICKNMISRSAVNSLQIFRVQRFAKNV